MSKTTFEELLEAGCHFGHLTRKWNPKMAPYIFMERNGIHIIDLHKTAVKIEEAAAAMKQIVKSGRKILFVATKKQAKSIVAEKVSAVSMPYVTERWAGGMLTNFPTIRKAVKKMTSIDKMSVDGTFKHLSKREKLQIARQRAKLEKNLGSIADLTRLPAALFVVDVAKEYIAVKEANRLGIPVFGIVDTNSSPEGVDFIIPANDDASNSIAIILDKVTEAVREGLAERKLEKEKEASDKKSVKAKKEEATQDKSEKKKAVVETVEKIEPKEKDVEKKIEQKAEPKEKSAGEKTTQKSNVEGKDTVTETAAKAEPEKKKTIKTPTKKAKSAENKDVKEPAGKAKTEKKNTAKEVVEAETAKKKPIKKAGEKAKEKDSKTVKTAKENVKTEKKVIAEAATEKSKPEAKKTKTTSSKKEKKEA